MTNNHRWLATAVLVLIALRAPAAEASPAPASPAQQFGGLYADVELRRLYPDSKTFADAVPRQAAARILADWRGGAPWTDEALRRFIDGRFDVPSAPEPPPGAPKSPDEPLAAHIAGLWPVLTRQPAGPAPGSSLLALPRPYVVPGGRFRELYYWDSYFTMLGLAADGRDDLVEAMIDDFGSLIDRYGHIPNGTRTYYLSRSQPPFFYLMVGLSQATDPVVKHRRLGWLRREYGWWMQGEQALKSRRGAARGHVVAMPDGAILNRYHDALTTPRDEAYREDVRVADGSGRPAAAVYADIRAAAESGWDFGSRWLGDGRNLATIRTTEIAPVDLNSLLYGLERAIAAGCKAERDRACAADFTRRADARAKAVNRWSWDAKAGFYRDVIWRTGQATPAESAATLYPLFTGLAPPAAARRVAAATRADLIAPGGLRTTLVETRLQWDRPNGWAPLQWIAVSGLRRYGEAKLADQVACRWLKTVAREYTASGRLLEKYDVETVRPGGGGEYPLQDGFGWTNGVTQALRRDVPEAATCANDAATADGGQAGAPGAMSPAPQAMFGPTLSIDDARRGGVNYPRWGKLFRDQDRGGALVAY